MDLPELHGTLIGDVAYESFAAYDHTRTLEEVGAIFGITRERIRQIEAGALTKIRSKISSGLIDISFFE